MLGYLSADIFCSEKRTVFRERISREIVSFEEQIMSKDRYPSKFLKSNGGCCYCHSTIFRNTSSFSWGIRSRDAFRPIAQEIIINNYWMRLSMISWIITQTRGFDNSWDHAITELDNCFLYIFHTIHPQKQTRSVQPFCFWGEHSKGLSNQTDVELDTINADIAFIMSSSQAIVNWLNALDRSDFS